MARGKYRGIAQYKGRTVTGTRTYRTKETAAKAFAKAKASKLASKDFKNIRVTTKEAISRSVMRGKKIFVGKYGRKPIPKQRAKEYLAASKR